MASRPCIHLSAAGSRLLSISSQHNGFSHTIIRTAASKAKAAPVNNAAKYKRADKVAADRRRARAARKSHYKVEPVSLTATWSLCDAMRIIRAFEAGYTPTSPKYDLALKFKTPKDGLVLKNRLTLPNPVRTDLRVAVITPSDGPIAQIAREAGAALVGTAEIFNAVKAGTISFERCICHEASFAELQKSGIARILGPRRLMPSPKEKTVVADVDKAVRELTSSAEYREKMGVVRLPVGQLWFTPEEMSSNIGAVLSKIKRDLSEVSDRVSKDIHEIVLSSTHAPGLTLNGDFSTKEGCRPEDLIERTA